MLQQKLVREEQLETHFKICVLKNSTLIVCLSFSPAKNRLKA